MVSKSLGKGRLEIFQSSQMTEHPQSDDQTLNLSVLSRSISESKTKPKLTIYSPEVTAVLRYIHLTTPAYSMSGDAARLLEKAVKKEYPDIWKAVVGK